MSVLRKKLSSTMILSGMSLGIQFFNFFIVNFVAKQLGVAEYGQFGILQQDFMWFLFLRDFGMTHVLMALFQKQPDTLTRQKSFWSMALLGLISATLFVFYTLTFRFNHPNFHAMWPLLFGIFFSPAILDWFFISDQRWKSLMAIKTCNFLCYAGLALWILQFPNDSSILYLSIALNIAHIISTLVAIYLFPTKIFTRVKLSIWKFFQDQFRKSSSFAIGGLLNFMLMPLGFYALDFMYSGERIIGIYNTSHRLIIILSGFIVHFLSSSIIHAPKGHNPTVSLKESIWFTLIVSVPLVTGVYFFGEWGLSFLYFGLDWTPSELTWARNNLLFLSISIAAQVFRANYISWFVIVDQSKHYLYVFVIAVIVNISVTYIGLTLGFKDYIAGIVMTGEIVLSVGLWLKYMKLRGKV